jgi:hypothetical protein
LQVQQWSVQVSLPTVWWLQLLPAALYTALHVVAAALGVAPAQAHNSEQVHYTVFKTTRSNRC